MYQGDVGVYPPTGNAELVKALTDGGANNSDWLGPYMEFKQDEMKDGEAIDSWGQPYIYTSINGGSPTHRPRSYDLYSIGPNGQDDDGAGDDIINW